MTSIATLASRIGHAITDVNDRILQQQPIIRHHKNDNSRPAVVYTDVCL